MAQIHSDHSPECAALIETAQSQINQGNALKALAHFQLATELEPTNLDALIGKIRALLRLGDVQQAARTCDQLRQAHETPLVWALHEVITTQFNAQTPPRHVNIGGGPFFNFTSWLNLESVPSPSNPIPTALSGETTFPVDDGSIATVFSSHSFEHLDDETVERCLRDARRVLDKEGVLVIKLPNFDDILNAWRNDDLDYFADATWNYTAIRQTWNHKGVEDTIDSRASMIFCGYWNAAYGDHFAHQLNFGPDAYHGPATCDSATFAELKASSSPWTIAKSLRTFVKNSEPEAIFNHRNAWSRDEFNALLEKTGFRVLSTDGKRICTHQSHIPGIETMFDISSYTLAVVDGEHS